MKIPVDLRALILAKMDQFISSAREMLDELDESQREDLIQTIGLGLQTDPQAIADRVASALPSTHFALRELAVVGFAAVMRINGRDVWPEGDPDATP